ncbi:hypothetical protein ACFTAO_25545 [Paenibacillus rhizoplanae]
MTTDHVTSLLIPNDWVNVAKFVQAAAKLLILWVSWLKADAGIIDSCIELLNWHNSNVYLTHSLKK